MKRPNPTFLQKAPKIQSSRRKRTLSIVLITLGVTLIIMFFRKVAYDGQTYAEMFPDLVGAAKRETTTYSEYRRLSEEQMDIGRFDFFPEEDRMIDATYFEELFMEAIKIAEEKNVPLYCGEYGVIDRADPEEALKWYRCIHEVFEKYHIGRAMWSYKEMDFGLVDAHYDPIRKELLELK